MKLLRNRFFFVFLTVCFLFIVILTFRVIKLYDLKLVTIDPRLDEISGIEFDKYQRLWAVNDGGDGPFLYHVQKDGKIKRKIRIENAKNNDWEDMTQNEFGHFFIGDFGNNKKDRDWLTVYRIENPIDIKTDSTKAEIIKFEYPRTAVPSEESSDQNFDLEAFVALNDKLYLFTKNRKKPFDGRTHLFSIGDRANNYEADYIDSFVSCTSFQMSCWITSAALSPSRNKLVLLDSNRLWLFENWQGDNFFSGDIFKIDLGVMTQKEAVTFADDNTVIFTDEEFKGIGRNAYVVKLDEMELEQVSFRNTP